MSLHDSIIQSQLIPPVNRHGILRRPRIETLLSKVLDYLLTVVQAGTGYGKTTALAALVGIVERPFWYTISETDRDPLLFFIHIISALGQHETDWGKALLTTLEVNGGRITPSALNGLSNALLHRLPSETIFVIDDYHFVLDVPEINEIVGHLIHYCPPRLHIVISTRQLPEFADLTRWRIKGHMATISSADLAFTADEIRTLFLEQYNTPLSLEQVQVLADETEGWAIALQMIWQSLRSGASNDLDAVLKRLPATLGLLFDYLASEVLSRQPKDIQQFLLAVSVLRQMEGSVCDALLDTQNSQITLHRLYESGLFIDSLGAEIYRYQRLFHDFLRSRLYVNRDQARILNRRAAAYFEQAGRFEDAIYHLTEAQDYEAAANLIEAIGPNLIRSGRSDSLTNWIGRLPGECSAHRPDLRLLSGDVFRLRANFEAALEHYVEAERLFARQLHAQGRSRALQGQAQIYLDTVRPLQADALLEDALHTLEPDQHREEAATLLDQLAENKLNLGYPEQAQSLHRDARRLRDQASPNDIYLEGRILLRTGQLADAQQALENHAVDEALTTQPRPQRFHRETYLLLSLICALQGSDAASEHYAREGIAIGKQLHSDFVETVGYMRLGHALQLKACQPWANAQQQEAMACYQRAIEQARAFKVARVWVEPLWGLCRAYGYTGDLIAAEQYATKALNITELAGDEWFSNMVRITMGASYVLGDQAQQAEAWLTRAQSGLDRVGDPFGRSAALLWLALNAWRRGDTDAAMNHLATLLPEVHAHGYEMLLTRRTHLGLKDEQASVPLLLEALRQNIEPEYVRKLLWTFRIKTLDYHPGHTLWVRTLGPFGVWRCGMSLTTHDWQREKARQLFQLFVNYRGQWFQREQIVDRLWPDLSADAAIRDFKVALNALNRALEPDRPRDVQPFFVLRREDTYGLNPLARIEIDADQFAQLAASPRVDDLRLALALYESDYLPDCYYEDWAESERERLRLIYLTAAEHLAQLLLRDSAWEEAITVCQAALNRDKCWEPAYRFLMHAYSGQGNWSQVQNTYNRCQTTLQKELGVEPSPQTRQLLSQLTRTDRQ